MTSRWKVAAAGGLVAVIALLVGAAVPLLPLFRADQALDGLVRAVALDWRDFGQPRAEERLQLELASLGLDTYVRASDCVMESRGDDRVVHCEWGTSLRVPLVHRRIPLRFESHARVDRTGDLQ